MDSSLLAFLGISALVIASPGPDTALTIHHTLVGGRRAGVFTAAGVAAGQGIWALATSLGLTALLLASEPVFLALKYAGAGYLVLLGLQALRAAWRGHEDAADVPAPRGAGLSSARAFRRGVVSDLANPKMAAFFTSLLPQFAPTGDGAFVTLVMLGALFALMTFAWLAGYAALVARAGGLFRRSGFRRSLEAATGAVLVTLGIRIAVEPR